MNINLNKNAPRWIIFSIDMGISVISLALAYLLRFNFSIPPDEIDTFALVFSYVLFFRGLTYLAFKSARGIVRHTSIADLQRLYLAVSTGTALMGTGNLINHYLLDGTFIVPFSVLFIEYVLTFFLTASFRAAIKLIYQEFSSPNIKKKTKVIIYGAGESGLTTKHALDRSPGKLYDIVAFIDMDTSKSGKALEGVRIYHESKLEKIIDEEKPDKFIIAVQEMDKDKKAQLIEMALERNIKALSVPPITDWINGQISEKQLRSVRIEELLGRKPIKLDQDKIAEQLGGKTVLVSGAAGSIGSGLVRQIARYFPEKIILLDQAETPLYELELELEEKYGNNLIEIVIGDITDQDRMNKLFSSMHPDIVYHAAAYKHVPMMENNPAEAVRTNVKGTKILVDLADRHGCEAFVMISTDKAVNPTNVMGASKRIAEIYAQAKNGVSKTKFITTRFGNVLGSNGSVIPIFTKQIAAGGPLTVTHPEITRYFMTIPEACQLVLEAGMMGKGGEIFIFDMGEPVKILNLAKKMIKLSGLEPERDIYIKFTGLRPGEKLYEELLANEENTMKTHHPQIMIAKVRSVDLNEIENDINELISLRKTQDNFSIVSKMKEIVPEYRSKNSIYSQLDKSQHKP